MSKIKDLTTYSFFLLLIITIYTTFFIKCVKSEEFMVGDSDEWNSQANFQSWSESYNFSVNDVLVFKYVKGQHDVFEVEESTYRSCDTSVGVLAKYDTGNDRVELKEARKYWFLCNIEGHCLGGMRFGIEVGQFHHSSNGTDTDSPSPQPSNIPSSSDLLSKGLGSLILILILVFPVLLFAYISLPL